MRDFIFTAEPDLVVVVSFSLVLSFPSFFPFLCSFLFDKTVSFVTFFRLKFQALLYIYFTSKFIIIIIIIIKLQCEG